MKSPYAEAYQVIKVAFGRGAKQELSSKKDEINEHTLVGRSRLTLTMNYGRVCGSRGSLDDPRLHSPTAERR